MMFGSRWERSSGYPTPKRDATKPNEWVRCRKCGSTSTLNRYVDVEVGRALGTCPSCFPTISSWGAICPACDAPRIEHEGPEERCPTLGVVESSRPLPAAPLAITAGEEIIDAEVVDLGCTCSAPRYDGDDGWDHDCPDHGAGATT